MWPLLDKPFSTFYDSGGPHFICQVARTSKNLKISKPDSSASYLFGRGQVYGLFAVTSNVKSSMVHMLFAILA